eukprot:g3013.t1
MAARENSMASGARAGVTAGTAHTCSQCLLVPFALVTSEEESIGPAGPIELLTAEEALLRSDALTGRLACPVCGEVVGPVRACTAGEQNRRAHFRHGAESDLRPRTTDMERLHTAESLLHMATKLYIVRNLSSVLFVHPACKEQEACMPGRLRFDWCTQTAFVEASLSWLQQQCYSTECALQANSGSIRPDVTVVDRSSRKVIAFIEVRHTHPRQNWLPLYQFPGAVCLEVGAGCEGPSETEAPCWARSRGLAAKSENQHFTLFYSLCSPENRLVCNECRPTKEARKQRELLAAEEARTKLRAEQVKPQKRNCNYQQKRKHKKPKQCERIPKCLPCNDTGRSYYTEGLYGPCHECRLGDQVYNHVLPVLAVPDHLPLLLEERKGEVFYGVGNAGAGGDLCRGLARLPLEYELPEKAFCVQVILKNVPNDTEETRKSLSTTRGEEGLPGHSSSPLPYTITRPAAAIQVIGLKIGIRYNRLEAVQPGRAESIVQNWPMRGEDQLEKDLRACTENVTEPPPSSLTNRAVAPALGYTCVGTPGRPRTPWAAKHLGIPQTLVGPEMPWVTSGLEKELPVPSQILQGLPLCNLNPPSATIAGALDMGAPGRPSSAALSEYEQKVLTTDQCIMAVSDLYMPFTTSMGPNLILYFPASTRKDSNPYGVNRVNVFDIASLEEAKKYASPGGSEKERTDCLRRAQGLLQAKVDFMTRRALAIVDLLLKNMQQYLYGFPNVYGKEGQKYQSQKGSTHAVPLRASAILALLSKSFTWYFWPSLPYTLGKP